MGRHSLARAREKKKKPKQKINQNMSLSFKVTLIQEHEQETRRFVLNEDTANSFVNIQQKLTSIFPALDQREPWVSWLDDDGDEVMIANDEELKLALAALLGPVIKLRVRQGGKKKDGEQCQAGELHPGIVCDGCDGPVLGPFYKCLACADYDLCKSCEGRGLHSQHKMVRLPQPCKRDTRGLVRCPLMWAPSSACNNQAMGMPGMFAELLATRPWAKGCQMKSPATATEKPADKTEQKESSEANKEEAKSEASKMTTATSNDNPSNLPGFLADLTPLLGPIQAEQLSQLLTTIQGSQLQEQLPQVGGLISTFLGPAALEAVFPLLETLANTQSVKSEAQQEGETEQKNTKEGSLEKESLRKNTEAEKEKLEDMEVEKSDEEKVDLNFEVIPPSSAHNSIYPTLPTEEQARLWKTNPMDSTNSDNDAQGPEDKESTELVTNADKKMADQDEAEDPKIVEALAQMKVMGFSDEGGWLSSLLKAKSGDVGKVLDVIQPNRQ